MVSLRNKIVLFALVLVAFLQPIAVAHAQVTPNASDIGGAGGSSCTTPSHWKVRWDAFSWTQYGEAEWTSNPCGLQLQERTVCNGSYGNYTKYSGIVKGVNIWAKKKCLGGDTLLTVSIHWRANSNSHESTFANFS